MFDDHNEFRTRFDAALKAQGDKLGAPEKKAIYKAVSWRDESAPPVIAKRSKLKAGDQVVGMGGWQAYSVVDGIRFDGMQCRRDIGYRAL
mgnify:CR=1 FL=1